MAGSFDIFKGPLKDNKGNLVALTEEARSEGDLGLTRKHDLDEMLSQLEGHAPEEGAAGPVATQGVNAQAVAEHAIALMLALARKLPEARDNQATKRWRGICARARINTRR